MQLIPGRCSRSLYCVLFLEAVPPTVSLLHKYPSCYLSSESFSLCVEKQSRFGWTLVDPDFSVVLGCFRKSRGQRHHLPFNNYIGEAVGHRMARTKLLNWESTLESD